ncbi:oxygenase MpaB family protein [Nocardia carnea]|uniref:oxygenase MpaB family protein n=1 Tax=Nocardia carnea TaxID=37328 RepID=UPI003D791172
MNIAPAPSYARGARSRWARIRSTDASARRFSGLEGPAAAIEEGQRPRRVHREIRGVDAAGRRYHALDANAYLWVAATGYWAGAVVRRLHAQESTIRPRRPSTPNGPIRPACCASPTG